jgi:4-amino-4-deoxy-L-arabinose transferase-like glycosyltransferase
MPPRKNSYLSIAQDPKRKAKAVAGAFVAILAVATGLRSYFLYHESMSPDEMYQRLVILRPYLEQISALRKDVVHPPLSYWLARAVSSVAGFDIFGLRLPATAFGLLTVALTMVLGFQLFRDRKIGLAAGLLVALSDLQNMLSHFARSYTMQAAVVLVYLLVLDRILRVGGRTRLWWLLAVLTLVLTYTHYLSWLFIIATLPVILLQARGQIIWLWTAVSTAAAGLSLPWILYVLPTLKNAGGLDVKLAWIKTPAFEALPALFARFSGPADSPAAVPISLLTALVVLAGGALAVRRAALDSSESGDSPSARPLLWGVAVLPPILLFLLAVSPFKLPIWGIRHLVPSQAPWALLLAYSAAHLAPSKRVVFPAVLLVLSGLQLAPTIDAARHYWFDPYKPAAQALTLEGGPSEALPLYAFENRERQIMSYYLKDEKNVILLPVGDKTLPARFWLLFHPNHEYNVTRLQRLEAAGYSIERRLDFIKKPTDTRGLCLVILRN